MNYRTVDEWGYDISEFVANGYTLRIHTREKSAARSVEGSRQRNRMIGIQVVDLTGGKNGYGF